MLSPQIFFNFCRNVRSHFEVSHPPQHFKHFPSLKISRVHNDLFISGIYKLIAKTKTSWDFKWIAFIITEIHCKICFSQNRLVDVTGVNGHHVLWLKIKTWKWNATLFSWGAHLALSHIYMPKNKKFFYP